MAGAIDQELQIENWLKLRSKVAQELKGLNEVTINLKLTLFL